MEERYRSLFAAHSYTKVNRGWLHVVWRRGISKLVCSPFIFSQWIGGGCMWCWGQLLNGLCIYSARCFYSNCTHFTLAYVAISDTCTSKQLFICAISISGLTYWLLVYREIAVLLIKASRDFYPQVFEMTLHTAWPRCRAWAHV